MHLRFVHPHPLVLQVLVDGPTNITGISRQVINLKRVSLTDFKVTIGRNSRQKALAKAWGKADVQAKWAASAWAKKLDARETKKTESDLDRFKAMVAKKEVCVYRA